MTKRNVLYIPGLGSKKLMNVQRLYVRTLNLFRSTTIHFFEPNWESSETSEDKYKRLSNLFEEKGRPGTLYASSAGAALAARLAVEQSDKISSCHLVCGKILGASKIQPSYSERAPALIDTVRASEVAIANLDHTTAQKIYCYTPNDRIDDGVIEVVDMIISGSHNVKLPPWSHAASIVYATLRYLPRL